MPHKDKGLSEQDAARLLEKFGPNKLPEKPPPSDLVIFLSQLKNPLVYILVFAGIVTVLVGHFSDAVIILFAVLVNTVLGFIQERRASRALFALKQMLHPKATVLRDGKQKQVDLESVVVGDLVIVNQGDKIPADGKLVFANRLFVEEAILTGEAKAVSKKKNDEVYMGTICISGQAKFVVEKVGSDTKMGAIALKIQEPDEATPLKRNLTKLSRSLSVLVFGLVAVVFLVGVGKGFALSDIFITSVSLAVSSIPEGLLVGLTVVLAIGMQRILKRKGLVRRLVSAETLGGVTVICLDKTGTLTQGKMSVVDFVGDRDALILQCLVANDLDDPIVIAAHDWANGTAKGGQLDLKKYKRIDSIPFSSKRRIFVSLNKFGDKNMLFANGAPEMLLEKAKLTKQEKAKYLKEIEDFAGRGRRVVGFARKTLSLTKTQASYSDVAKMDFMGILVFDDPVRGDVSDVLHKTKQAGIKTLVITGDYPQTAQHVMTEIGMKVSNDTTLLGKDVEKMSEKELAQVVGSGVNLFARTTPDLKLKIVAALKIAGEVVAMMGDGVNDAPALKKADIGIVVGDASDVAKETADLVLLDSKFATVLAAIEEGRGIFQNIRKIILYLLSDAFSEIVAILGSMLLGLPLAVTAGQILWINLVSDGFPDLALTVDKNSPDLMRAKPISKQNIMTTWMKLQIGVISVTAGLIALSLFVYSYTQTQDVTYSRSVAFLSLGVNSLFFVYSVRTLTNPFWKSELFANKWLNVAVVAGFVLQFLPFYFAPLGKFLGVTRVGLEIIAVIIISSLLMFAIIEVMKSIFRKNMDWFSH